MGRVSEPFPFLEFEKVQLQGKPAVHQTQGLDFLWPTHGSQMCGLDYVNPRGLRSLSLCGAVSHTAHRAASAWGVIKSGPTNSAHMPVHVWVTSVFVCVCGLWYCDVCVIDCLLNWLIC